MNMIKTFFKYLFIMAICHLTLVSCSLEDDTIYPDQSANTDGFCIEALSQDMMEQKVSRSAIQKTPEEGKINNLYLFFFDSDGQYLETANENVFKPFMAPSQGVHTVNIPTENVFSDPSKAGSVWVYALANVSSEVIADNDSDGYPDNFPKGGKDGKSPKLLFEEFVYTPLMYDSYNRLDITKLPAEGMPMVGKCENTINLTSKGNLTIQMEALMARVDIEIMISSDETDETNKLPKLQLAQWWVNNMPTVTPFTQPSDGNSNLTSDQLLDTNPIEENLEVYNGTYNPDSKISLTFYMFENLNGGDKTAPPGFYPSGITTDDYQRWKPTLAEEYGIDEKATYFEMLTYYSTYNDDNLGSATYEIKFRFYLGADHTKNFDVGRNRHYKNSITITGLTQVGNNPEHITYDARVNISQQDNPFYISILRERKHDAHFCVTPMDVYMFGGDGVTDMRMTVSIDDPDNHKWIRMEKIPAANMEAGTVPDDYNGDYIVAATLYPDNKSWHAGNGKRKYFTTDLVTGTLKDNKSCELTTSRDRIYFYIDENLSLQNRTATINLSYTDSKNTTPRTRTLIIEQVGLKKVTVPGDKDNPTQTIYIEQFEEYLDHYDPLDEHATEQIYDGLPWGYNGIYFGDHLISNLYNDKWTKVYYNGLEATWHYINRGGGNELDLNTPASSAAQYCLNKNKRKNDGSGIVEQKSTGWFLPGIRQLENMLTTYWNTYPEFQENFYWSSAVGKYKGYVDYYEEATSARATKAFRTPQTINGEEYNYAPSDWNFTFTDKSGLYGKAPRNSDNVHLRIRAAYIGPLDE